MLERADATIMTEEIFALLQSKDLREPDRHDF
jgi:hypothetical protein